MKSKSLLVALSLVAGITLLAGCGSNASNANANGNANGNVNTSANANANANASKDSTTDEKADAVSGASQVNDEEAFEQKISKDNTNYMIIVNKDLTFSKDLIVESGVKKDAPNRSIAPALENEDKTIAERYTITVPNLVFAGENGKIEYGIIKGDVYVQAPGFILKDATIDGNLYFATQELMDAFKQDETTTISGNIEVKEYTK